MRVGLTMLGLCVVVAVALGNTPAPATPVSVPVRVGGDAKLDACHALGLVVNPVPQSNDALAVRSGPNAKYDLLDRLATGHEVFVCNTSKDGKWFGVVYARGQALASCGVATPIATAQDYGGPCKSGWVSAPWVRLIAE